MKLQKLLKGRSPDSGCTPDIIRNNSIISHQDANLNTAKPETASDSKILQPTQYDVLFGRGKPFQGHSGNVRLHKVVDLYKGRYSQARRHEKTEIAEEIVQFIKNGGAKAGRFLKRVEGEECWVQVSDSIARDKVSHALRGKPRKDDYPAKLPVRIEDAPTLKRAAEPAAPQQIPVKRQKLSRPNAPELELFNAQRDSLLPHLSRSTALLASTGFPMSLPMDLRAQLVASTLGISPQVNQFGGLQGLVGPSVPFPGALFSNQQSIVNPVLAGMNPDITVDGGLLWRPSA